MNRDLCASEHMFQPSTISGRRAAVVLLALLGAGCAATDTPPDPRPSSATPAVEYRSADFKIRLVGGLRAGDAGTLVEHPGWVEYILSVDNIGSRPLWIHNVKILDSDGRFFDSAASYEQLASPPDAASEIAGSVATRVAGVAAGQVIPFGGTIVGILSGAVSASAAESKASHKLEFERRKLKSVELAPEGKVTGSAFLPHVTNAAAIIVDYGHGEQVDRIEIALPRSQ